MNCSQFSLIGTFELYCISQALHYFLLSWENDQIALFPSFKWVDYLIFSAFFFLDFGGKVKNQHSRKMSTRNCFGLLVCLQIAEEFDFHHTSTVCNWRLLVFTEIYFDSTSNNLLPVFALGILNTTNTPKANSLTNSLFRMSYFQCIVVGWPTLVPLADFDLFVTLPSQNFWLLTLHKVHKWVLNSCFVAKVQLPFQLKI